jgi:hypothetical protein
MHNRGCEMVPDIIVGIAQCTVGIGKVQIKLFIERPTDPEKLTDYWHSCIFPSGRSFSPLNRSLILEVQISYKLDVQVLCSFWLLEILSVCSFKFPVNAVSNTYSEN